MSTIRINGCRVWLQGLTDRELDELLVATQGRLAITQEEESTLLLEKLSRTIPAEAEPALFFD